MKPSRQYKLFRDSTNIIDISVAANLDIATDVDSDDFSDLTSSTTDSASDTLSSRDRAARVTSLLNS